MLKAVLAGCGGMGNNWARILGTRNDIEIVGLVDVARPAAERLRDGANLSVEIYDDLHVALESCTPDVVLDTSIPETRRQLAGTALEAGCHVLTEKPLATSMQEAKELVRLAESNSRTLAVMQNRRYLPGSLQVKNFIESGAIGEIGLVCADFFLGAHFEGFRLVMENVLLVDMAIHTFDQARYMTGLDCSSAYCHEFNTPDSWYEGNASAFCIFEMTGGVPFCYRGSWTAEGAQTTWESAWRVVGSRGTLIWDGSSPPYVDQVSSDHGFARNTTRVESTVEWGDRLVGHAGCLDEMIGAISNDRQPMTQGSDNIKSLGMVFAAIDSAKSGSKSAIADLA